MKGLYLTTFALLIGTLFALAGCARQNTAPAVEPVAPAAPAYGSATTNCFNCATVAAITPIPENSGGAPVASIVGAVIGGVIGHQFGSGSGQTATTIGGAAAGAYIGSQYSDGDKYDYRVTVRRESGATRTFVVDQPPKYGVGTEVKLNAR